MKSFWVKVQEKNLFWYYFIVLLAGKYYTSGTIRG